MGVRLNKVLTELNIGLQTAVDFLKNKKSLGEMKDDVTPNTKISDEQQDTGCLSLLQETEGEEGGGKRRRAVVYRTAASVQTCG